MTNDQRRRQQSRNKKTTMNDDRQPSSMSVRIDGKTWLVSTPSLLKLHAFGRWFTNSGGGLRLTAGPVASTGSDKIGDFSTKTWTWSCIEVSTEANNRSTSMEISVRSYADGNTVVLRQAFPDGVAGGMAQNSRSYGSSIKLVILPSAGAEWHRF